MFKIIGAVVVLVPLVYFGGPLVFEGTTDSCVALEARANRELLQFVVGGDPSGLDREYVARLLDRALNQPAWLACTNSYWDLWFRSI